MLRESAQACLVLLLVVPVASLNSQALVSKMLQRIHAQNVTRTRASIGIISSGNLEISAQAELHRNTRAHNTVSINSDGHLETHDQVELHRHVVLADGRRREERRRKDDTSSPRRRRDAPCDPPRKGNIDSEGMNIEFGGECSEVRNKDIVRPQYSKSQQCRATNGSDCQDCVARDACFHGGPDQKMELRYLPPNQFGSFTTEVWARCSGTGTWAFWVDELQNGVISVFENGILKNETIKATSKTENVFPVPQSGDLRVRVVFRPIDKQKEGYAKGIAIRDNDVVSHEHVVNGTVTYEVVFDKCMDIKNCLGELSDNSSGAFEVRNSNKVQLACTEGRYASVPANAETKCLAWRTCLEKEQNPFTLGPNLAVVRTFLRAALGGSKMQAPIPAPTPKPTRAAPATCNWRCYLDRYPDLQRAFGAKNIRRAKNHYYKHGRREGRDCTCNKASCTKVTTNPVEADRTYSSVWSNDRRGTRHCQSKLNSPQAWSAAKNGAGQWMSMDLGKVSKVWGVVTQGRRHPHSRQYVKTYKVKYSEDGSSWKAVPGIFQGGHGDSRKEAAFPQGPVLARYVKLVVQTWNSHISMRAALVTCVEAGFLQSQNVGETGGSSADVDVDRADKGASKTWGADSSRKDVADGQTEKDDDSSDGGETEATGASDGAKDSDRKLKASEEEGFGNDKEEEAREDEADKELEGQPQYAASVTRETQSKDCFNPATEDPESWECDCLNSMLAACNNRLSVICFRALLCKDTRICSMWKMNHCGTLPISLLQSMSPNTTALLTKRERRAPTSMESMAEGGLDEALTGKCSNR